MRVLFSPQIEGASLISKRNPSLAFLPPLFQGLSGYWTSQNQSNTLLLFTTGKLVHLNPEFMNRYCFLPMKHRRDTRPADTDSITFRHLKPFVCVKSNPTGSYAINLPSKGYVRGRNGCGGGEQKLRLSYTAHSTSWSSPIPSFHVLQGRFLGSHH